MVTATDAAYLPFAGVMAGTLAAHRSSDVDVTLTVVHRGIGPADRDRLARSAPGIGLRWVEITEAHLAGLEPTAKTLARQPHYFRCLLPGLLPEVPRAIYLDADTMVLADLTELWSTDLAGAPLGAVRDSLGTIEAAIDRWRVLGIDGDAPYFNSGVMLIDLDVWRATGAGLAALRRCAQDRDHLLARNRWPQHDQYGLNVVFHRRWRALAPEWNHFSFAPWRPARVVHFLSDSGRPGARYCDPRYTEAFFDAIAHTAWAGWRPPVPAGSEP